MPLVRSTKLTPVPSSRRVIEAPACGRSWSSATTRLPGLVAAARRGLRERGAVGLAVNVETVQGLARLRTLAPGVLAAPWPETTWLIAWACGTTRR